MRARLRLAPDSGPPGIVVQVRAKGFAPLERVRLFFLDSVAGRILLGTFMTDATGTLATQVTIPLTATIGAQRIGGIGHRSAQTAKKTFTVT